MHVATSGKVSLQQVMVNIGGVMDNGYRNESSLLFFSRSICSKSTQSCAGTNGRLQHIMQWIPATRGTCNNPQFICV